ncbi:SGNH/GDSL hydrolase family protein [Hufsiella ginkgonis]|uniref:T9SS type A sorting domain-containing protein n=1 Tax=Hufsiella ginkgonis TaxID=2695274 RepID=A0A7K1XWB7_9SPHI|nr:SGNH/GDSL hydrolase family protein [Hufsiella ginkgonis]MXV15117.1 T9SS type A sorting domain-containing protein [Hufsiella ginkgonis]
MADWKVALNVVIFFFLFPLSLVAQQPNCSQASQFYTKDSISIVTFGASTVAGVGGAGFQGYLQKQIAYCYTGKTIQIDNFAVPGETTVQGLSRIDAAIAGHSGFFFILMGANDALRITDGKMKLAETESSMRKIIQKCLASNLTVVLGTIQNFNDTKSEYYKRANANVIRINGIYRRLAAEYKLDIADINNTLRRDFRLYHDDIHPNNRGYMVISYVWFDALNNAIEKHFLEMYISQNFPNPAIGSASFLYTVPAAGEVTLTIYDLNGRPVKYLLKEYLSSGVYQREFFFNELSPGIYVYSYQTGGKRIVRKMLVGR